MLNKNDVKIVRELAARVAEIASLPIQDEKRMLWRKLNARVPARPMVMIDQVCWNEINVAGDLTLCCTDAECRGYEQLLRRTIFQNQYFPVDMVVEAFIQVPKAVYGIGFDLKPHEQLAITDATNEVMSHRYYNLFQHEDDLEKIHIPPVSHDAFETDRRLCLANELFNGLLEVRLSGVEPYLSLWDPIATWMGVENALFAMVDKPEFIHRMLDRMTSCYLSMLDQLEDQGLLCRPQSLIHCTGAYSDELPSEGYNPQKPRTKDIWMFGLAQMLSCVSPKMFMEFEVNYISRICSRFGLVYYGCCDPLDDKMAEVRMIPNVRKVSMSPWADQERGAVSIGTDFVFSRKPNPAFLATERFSPDQVREDLGATRRICEDHGCPLEFIQKDISTVRYEPQRLFKWAQIAMQVVGG